MLPLIILAGDLSKSAEWLSGARQYTMERYGRPTQHWRWARLSQRTPEPASTTKI